jgi:hypothetical protein
VSRPPLSTRSGHDTSESSKFGVGN